MKGRISILHYFFSNKKYKSPCFFIQSFCPTNISFPSSFFSSFLNTNCEAHRSTAIRVEKISIFQIGKEWRISLDYSYVCQQKTNCHLHHSCSPYMASITVKPTSICVSAWVPHCFIFQSFMFFVSFPCLHFSYIDGNSCHYLKNVT